MTSESKKVVTYIDINVDSIEAYWSEIIAPNVKQFQEEPSSRSLFNLVGSIWHLVDWVWHDQNPGKNSRKEFESFRDELLVACPELNHFRDIAEAAKHRGLGRSPIPKVKRTEPHVAKGGNVKLLGADGGNIVTFWIKFNDGFEQTVNEVLRRVIEFWLDHLKAKGLTSPLAQGLAPPSA